MRGTHPFVDAYTSDVGESTSDFLWHAKQDVELVDDVRSEVVDDIVVLSRLFFPRRSGMSSGKRSISVVVGCKVDQLAQLHVSVTKIYH